MTGMLWMKDRSINPFDNPAEFIFIKAVVEGVNGGDGGPEGEFSTGFALRRFTNTQNLQLSISKGKDELGATIPSLRIETPTGSIPIDDEWRHVAFTVGPAGTFVYINGVQRAFDAAHTPVLDNDAPLVIGSTRAQNPLSNIQPYDGFMDDIQFYNTQLSGAQIQAIFLADEGGICEPPPPQCTPAPQGLTALWNAEDVTDDTAKDKARSNDGALFPRGAVAVTPSKDGLGTAFEFTGVDAIIVPDAGALEPREMTMVAWINSNPGGHIGNIFNKRDTFFDPTLGRLFLDNSGYDFISFLNDLGLRSSNTISFEPLLSTNGGIVFDQWHHVAATIGPDGRQLFIDGVLEESDDIEFHTSVFFNSQDLFIGSDFISVFSSGEQEFRGKMDELQIYNRVLDIAEIQTIKNAELGICPTDWVCGNGVIEGTEECDPNILDPLNPNLNGESCSFGGTISCTSKCELEKENCSCSAGGG